MKQKYLSEISSEKIIIGDYLKSLLTRIFHSSHVDRDYTMEGCSKWKVKLCVYKEDQTKRRMHLYSDEGSVSIKDMEELKLVELKEGLYFLHVVKEGE
ncbi:MAG: hypothetical protein RR202_11095 [Bacteroidales bacterium]